MKNFVVSARKYRPDKFNDVVGQASITATLKNSIKKNHLGHAYLFSGPRGVGKTTCARIFARTINCFNLSEEGEACNVCESCEAFNNNRSYNIHELDAASNNSVEDIRNLTDQVRIPPQIGSYSIYIIDEVHMLSQQAFNAFLKTLEEPPAHAIFILATTEKHKIIPTILSRCQIYDFNRIGVEDIVNYLKHIAGNEKINYEEDALQIIASKADGAMRDALSIFDQIVSFSGNAVTYAAVIENLNILDYEYYFKMTEAFLKNDLPASLLLFDDVLRRGFDARNFINGYSDHLRDLLLCKDPQTLQLLDTGAGIRERYLLLSQKVKPGFLITALDICNQADIQFRASKNQRLTIELALVKLSQLVSDQKKKVTEDTGSKNLTPEAKHSDQNNEPEVIKETSGPSGSSEPLPSSERSVIREGTISIKDSISGNIGESKHVVPEANNEEDLVGEFKEPEPQIAPEKLTDAWNRYAASMEKRRPRVFSTLKSHQPGIDTNGNMIIRLNTEAQKENFIKNIRPGLINFFKAEFGPGEYLIEAYIDENHFIEKKLYTDQDKFDYLTARNPDLVKLKNLFNLDFDD